MGTLLPVSVLDIAPVEQGASAADALATTLALARHAEALGCNRLWVAEHHNAPSIASSSPAVILAVLGAVTSRIRLGSGGVLLLNHSPLVVAEQFGTLNAFYPGRFDLGIGRAPGGDSRAAQALRRVPDERFSAELADLTRLLAGDFPGVTAVPRYAGSPQMWLLGSGTGSARLAAALGLPFAFAHHFKPENTVDAVAIYRREFKSGTIQEPYVMVCVQAVCAEDDQRARMLADPGQLSVLRFPHQPQLTVEQAQAHEWTPEDRAWASGRQALQAIGGPETVRDRLTDIIETVTPDELMITNVIADEKARLDSLTRVRELFPG
jgi:luciferase family oxidoreductase group 1